MYSRELKLNGYAGVVSKQTSEVQETREAASKGASSIRPTRLQWRHDEKYLPWSSKGIPALSTSYCH